MLRHTTTRSPVDLFLDKLPATIIQEIIGCDSDALFRRRALVSKGEEALRILKARKAVLASKESPITRAGLVVDYLCRKGQIDGSISYRRSSIPMKILLHALNIKGKKHVEQMQAMVSSHLETYFQMNPTRPTQKRKRRSNDSPTQNASSMSSNCASKAIPSTDTIRDLSIRLGPMIHNAELVASYARKLFRGLISYTNQPAVKGGLHSKHHQMLMCDVSRHVEYYEAACFFLAVQKLEGSTHSMSKRPHKTNSSKNAAKQSSTTEESDADNKHEHTDSDDDIMLNEMDISKVANLREGVFNEVIECVRSHTQDNDMLLSSCQANSQVSSLYEGSSACAPVSSNECPSNQKYESWKCDVLEKAKRAARCMIMDGRSVNSRAFDDKELLQVAADDVLRKFGIV